MGELFGILISGLVLISLFIALPWVAISYGIKRYEEFGNVMKRWHHFFEGQTFSTQEIYHALTVDIQSRKIDHLSITQKEYIQASIFIGHRLYLKLVREHQVVLICAAPFADGFFISWWSGEHISFWRDMAGRLPFIGERLERWLAKRTFFQMDTDNMFNELVKGSVLKLVDQLNSTTGIRPLSELERRPIEISSSKN